MDTLNPWLPLPDGWQAQSDEKLGWWLVAAWIGMHAEKAGISRDAIPHAWAESLIAASAGMDSDSVENAPLESAFRKACKGDMAAAGRMLREIIMRGAVELVKDKAARTGAKQLKGAAAGHKTRSQQSEAKSEVWQARAAELWVMPLHKNKSANDIARLIANEYCKDKDGRINEAEAKKKANTMRRKIRKP